MLAPFHLTINYSGSWALKMDQQGLLHWILRTEFVPIKLSMWKQMKKRKHDALERTRCIRSRIDRPEEMQPAPESNPGPSNTRPAPANYGYPPPVQVTD